MCACVNEIFSKQNKIIGCVTNAGTGVASWDYNNVWMLPKHGCLIHVLSQTKALAGVFKHTQPQLDTIFSLHSQ